MVKLKAVLILLISQEALRLKSLISSQRTNMLVSQSQLNKLQSWISHDEYYLLIQ